VHGDCTLILLRAGLDCDEPCGTTNNGSFATDWLYNNGTWPAAFVGAAYPHMLDLMIYEGMGAPGKQYVRLLLLLLLPPPPPPLPLPLPLLLLLPPLCFVTGTFGMPAAVARTF
jgi:hypothetical protein